MPYSGVPAKKRAKVQQIFDIHKFLSKKIQKSVIFMQLSVIARAKNGFTSKFGIPRQSRETSLIHTRIVFEPEFRDANMLRGLESYSHLWLIWGFSQSQGWSPTVRPPRLGGNTRVGVWATRSPFRPNPIGLTSVRLEAIDHGDLIVTGADLLDGTPIYDIKPYLSFSDSHPDALNGFAESTKDYRLPVVYPDNMPPIDEDTLAQLTEILSQDPRPAYQDDPSREYGLDYAGWSVHFVVHDNVVRVVRCEAPVV